MFRSAGTALLLVAAAVLACQGAGAEDAVAGGSTDAAAVRAAADPALNPGFAAFFSNDYDTAISYFADQVRKQPNDAGQYNHLAQAILYRELFRNGALESQLVSGNNAFLRREKMHISSADKARLMDCLDKAQTLSEARTDKSPNDYMAWYELGVTHGLRANYSFLVEKAWTESLKQATAARKADDRALELNAQFVDANLIPAVYQYVVGSLPFFLRTLGFIGGFHGDRAEGMRRLELVADKGVLNRYDAQVLLAVLYRRERRPSMAIPLLKSLSTKFPRNNLLRFEQIQMYSDGGDKKSAMDVLTSIEQLRRQNAPGYADIPAAKVQFVAGNLNFWYNDIPTAVNNFQLATRGASQLDLNMAVIAWLRLGQVYDLQGSHERAIPAYEETMKCAPESDAALEAKGYISHPYQRKHKDDKRG